MVILNDYLYSGDTVLRILHNYIKDLRKDAKKTGNEIDMIHCNFLLQIQELLEHNDFLTAQSQKIRDPLFFGIDPAVDRKAHYRSDLWYAYGE